MSVLDRIDEYITRNNTKKKIIRESADINADILELLNSLDDSMLDDGQLELKERILSSNFETEENDVPDEDDDIVIDDVDNIEADGQVSDEDEPEGLDDIIDDVPEIEEPEVDNLTGVEMEDEYFNPNKYKVEGKVIKKEKSSPKKNKYKEPERVGKSKKKKK